MAAGGSNGMRDSNRDRPSRPLPTLTPENRDFWTGGAQGVLRIQCCQVCGEAIHPPRPRCPSCLSRDLASQAMSGRGRIFSFTVNHHPWRESLELPYVVALVELEEHPGVRLATNLVGCSPDEVQIGMAVEVVFERHGEVYVPLFQLLRGA